jgi:hypothetical protein
LETVTATPGELLLWAAIALAVPDALASGFTAGELL